MEKFFSIALQAAEMAGSLIKETWQQAKQVHYKSAIDLVTTVDRQAEERIVHLLQKHFPDHSIPLRFESGFR